MTTRGWISMLAWTVGGTLALGIAGCRSGDRASNAPCCDKEPTFRSADGRQPDEAAEFAGEDAERFNPPPGERRPPVRPRLDDRRAERDQPRIRQPR